MFKKLLRNIFPTKYISRETLQFTKKHAEYMEQTYIAPMKAQLDKQSELLQNLQARIQAIEANGSTHSDVAIVIKVCSEIRGQLIDINKSLSVSGNNDAASKEIATE